MVSKTSEAYSHDIMKKISQKFLSHIGVCAVGRYASDGEMVVQVFVETPDHPVVREIQEFAKSLGYTNLRISLKSDAPFLP